MKLTVLPRRVLLDGLDLLTLKESDRFLASFGQSSRRRDIPMHPSGICTAMVWGLIGLVAYEDRPDRLMSHLYLAFSSADTPEHPERSSNAIIEINGGVVNAETSERTLPLDGPTPISVDYGKHFFYGTELYGVEFLF